MGASPPPERVASPAAVAHPALEAAGSMRAFCRKRRGRWASGSGRLSSVGKEFPPQKVPSLHPPPHPAPRQLGLPCLLAGGLAGRGKGRPGSPGEWGSSPFPLGPRVVSFPEPSLVPHMGQDSLAPGLSPLVPWRWLPPPTNDHGNGVSTPPHLALTHALPHERETIL